MLIMFMMVDRMWAKIASIDYNGWIRIEPKIVWSCVLRNVKIRTRNVAIIQRHWFDTVKYHFFSRDQNGVANRSSTFFQWIPLNGPNFTSNVFKRKKFTKNRSQLCPSKTSGVVSRIDLRSFKQVECICRSRSISLKVNFWTKHAIYRFDLVFHQEKRSLLSSS